MQLKGIVTFDLGPSAERVDIVRLFIGTKSGDYNRDVVLKSVTLDGRRGTAMESVLANTLNKPGVYFVALKVIDTSGRESDFSNELRIDTRVGSASLLDVFTPLQQWARVAAVADSVASLQLEPLQLELTRHSALES